MLFHSYITGWREGKGSFTWNRIFYQNVAVTIDYSSHYRVSQYIGSEKAGNQSVMQQDSIWYKMYMYMLCICVNMEAYTPKYKQWLSQVIDYSAESS